MRVRVWRCLMIAIGRRTGYTIEAGSAGAGCICPDLRGARIAWGGVSMSRRPTFITWSGMVAIARNFCAARWSRYARRATRGTLLLRWGGGVKMFQGEGCRAQGEADFFVYGFGKKN
jgi:hypothetical protein